MESYSDQLHCVPLETCSMFISKPVLMLLMFNVDKLVNFDQEYIALREINL